MITESEAGGVETPTSKAILCRMCFWRHGKKYESYHSAISECIVKADFSTANARARRTCNLSLWATRDQPICFVSRWKHEVQNSDVLDIKEASRLQCRSQPDSASSSCSSDSFNGVWNVENTNAIEQKSEN